MSKQCCSITYGIQLFYVLEKLVEKMVASDQLAQNLIRNPTWTGII